MAKNDELHLTKKRWFLPHNKKRVLFLRHVFFFGPWCFSANHILFAMVFPMRFFPPKNIPRFSPGKQITSKVRKHNLAKFKVCRTVGKRAVRVGGFRPNCFPVERKTYLFDRIHVWYIYLHLPRKSTKCR